MPAVAVIRVQTAPFSLEAEMAALTGGRTDIGGVASFVGLVRATDGVTSMTLEHYPGMTERSMEAIAAEAIDRWTLSGCTIIHRVGRLEPGAPIVLVLTAAAHRAATLEACHFLIDWLKTRAPFWKQETFADGRQEWVSARDTDETAAARWSVSDPVKH
jgi:molybdopterin synthase catalytic subunit